MAYVSCDATMGRTSPSFMDTSSTHCTACCHVCPLVPSCGLVLKVLSASSRSSNQNAIALKTPGV
jgi:hypothetical protein